MWKIHIIKHVLILRGHRHGSPEGLFNLLVKELLYLCELLLCELLLCSFSSLLCELKKSLLFLEVITGVLWVILSDDELDEVFDVSIPKS